LNLADATKISNILLADFSQRKPPNLRIVPQTSWTDGVNV
jgi:hypothetical protein